MVDLNEMNRIWLKVNELEDSKYGQSEEKKYELLSRQLSLMYEMYTKLGEIICRF